MTERLEWWKAQLLKAAGIDTVYGLFNNDYSGYSVATCDRFKRVLGLPVTQSKGMGDLFH